MSEQPTYHETGMLIDGQQIRILSGEPGRTFNVIPLLTDVNDFRADPNIHHLIDFKKALASLAAQNRKQWSREKLPNRGIVILEYYSPEARKLMDEIDVLAQTAIQDQRQYDNPSFGENYYELAKEGYEMLRENEQHFGIPSIQQPVALERAGLVSVRLALGLDKDAIIPNEIRVATKRVHLTTGHDKEVATTVQWRNRSQLKTIRDGVLDVIDFVNPASWASTAGLTIAAMRENATPHSLIHRSISSTHQGIEFAMRQLSSWGVGGVFYSVGVSESMNELFYLNQKGRSVADAGRAMRRYLPSWYTK